MLQIHTKDKQINYLCIKQDLIKPSLTLGLNSNIYFDSTEKSEKITVAY
jgi:hypothetical protein